MAHRPKSTGHNGGAAGKVAVAGRPVSKGIHNNNSSNQEKRQIVGQYMIGKTIGEGTFGKVKLAVHIPTGEKVAVKILEKSRIKEQADVRRVNREIKILKKARHGNIIQLYEVLDTKTAIYLIMECAEGGELFDFIVAQKRVPEVQACKFFHQIIDGLEVLHRSEITHRDLKPENLLLKASPEGWVVKIVDFGLSNTHEGGRLLATACGSPCYAAPEMIAGKKYVGPLADLWSVGVILFALVSGYLPFEDANTNQLYKKILSGDYQCPKWISPEVKDMIGCLLETDPRKRYTVQNIRRHAWYNIVPEAAIPRDILHDHSHDLKNDHQATAVAATSGSATAATVATTAVAVGQHFVLKDTRSETLHAIAASGVDPQAVLDSVSSHAYNSLSALYFLFEQKHRTQRMKKEESSRSQIRQNSSNFSNKSSHPETATADSDQQYNSKNGAVTKQQQQQQYSQQSRQQSQRQQNSHVGVTAVRGTTPGSVDAVNGDQHGSPNVRAGGIGYQQQQQQQQRLNTNPVAPYLQPPKILMTAPNSGQPSSSHGHRRGAQADKKPVAAVASEETQSNMPSLDQYMRNNLNFPDENQQQQQQNMQQPLQMEKQAVDSSSSNRSIKGRVPVLNLHTQKSSAASTGKDTTLQSQTERRSQADSSQQQQQQQQNGDKEPSSARAVLPSLKNKDSSKQSSGSGKHPANIPQLSANTRMKVVRETAAAASASTSGANSPAAAVPAPTVDTTGNVIGTVTGIIAFAPTEPAPRKSSDVRTGPGKTVIDKDAVMRNSSAAVAAASTAATAIAASAPVLVETEHRKCDVTQPAEEALAATTAVVAASGQVAEVPTDYKVAEATADEEKVLSDVAATTSAADALEQTSTVISTSGKAVHQGGDEEALPVEHQPVVPAGAPSALRGGSVKSSSSRRGRNISFSESVQSGSGKSTMTQAAASAAASASAAAGSGGGNIHGAGGGQKTPAPPSSKAPRAAPITTITNNDGSAGAVAVIAAPKRPSPKLIQAQKPNTTEKPVMTGIPSGEKTQNQSTNPRTMALKNKIAARGSLS